MTLNTSNNDRAIRDLLRPFRDMVHQCADDTLGAQDPVYIIMRFCKKFAQPVFATNGAGKVEFVKNGKFFFFVKDRYVAE